jgi:hypothetical protein
MKYAFHPEALGEYVAAAHEYEERQPGLGLERDTDQDGSIQPARGRTRGVEGKD